MPETTFLPDDGSVMWAEMDAAEFVAAAAPVPPLVSLLPWDEWIPQVMDVQLQQQSKRWRSTDPGGEPGYGPLITFPGTTVGWAEVELADHSVAKTTTSGGVTTTEHEYAKSRWRLVWAPKEPMEAPQAWNFLHWVWRPRFALSVNGESSGETFGTRTEITWQGGPPPGFDPEDLDTWPGTDWIVTEPPDCPPPDNPPPGESAGNTVATHWDWVWPHKGFEAAVRGGAPPLMAPGRVPGAMLPGWPYQRPWLNGVVFGEPPEGD